MKTARLPGNDRFQGYFWIADTGQAGTHMPPGSSTWQESVRAPWSLGVRELARFGMHCPGPPSRFTCSGVQILNGNTKVPSGDDEACLGLLSPQQEGAFCVHTTGSRPKLVVSADGRGVVSHAGSRLLTDRSRRCHQPDHGLHRRAAPTATARHRSRPWPDRSGLGSDAGRRRGGDR
jgi:hypothetical protein